MRLATCLLMGMFLGVAAHGEVAGEDCNGNGVPDWEDIANGTSTDCDEDGVPDECQGDCDGDGVPDPCEPDIDGDGIPDNCEEDCNENGWPDEWELLKGYATDCDENGQLDECDIAQGIHEDCDENGMPDVCDIADGTHEDCNENSIPDFCEAFYSDLDGDGVLDACEFANGELVFYGGLMTDHLITHDLDGGYGFAIDLVNDYAVVTCSGSSGWGADLGNLALDIYKLDDGQWTREYRIDEADDFESMDYCSVSLSPPFLATGTYSEDVTVYRRVTEADDPSLCNGAIRWDPVVVILEPDGLFSFGSAVAMKESTLAIGATEGGSGSCTVEIYEVDFSGGEATHVQSLRMSDFSDYAAVAAPRGVYLDGDRLLVSWAGGQTEDVEHGAVVFRRTADSKFELEANLTLPYEHSEGDYVWPDVDIDGDYIVVDAGVNGDIFQQLTWVFAYDDISATWELDGTLEDDLPSYTGSGTHSAISGDLIFSFMRYLETAQAAYGGRAVATWRRIDDEWQLISRTPLPKVSTDYLSDPGIPSAADGMTFLLGGPLAGQAVVFSMDADNDGVMDIDQVAQNPKIDKDWTGVPDVLEPDCNGNGIADARDITLDPSLDADPYVNGEIDSCEPDNNGDGVPDWYDAVTGPDYNENWINDWDEEDWDCNSNGLADVVEIYLGMLEDYNGDWIPDICQCLADLSGDGVINVTDLLLVIAVWGETCTVGDMDGDNTITINDMLYLIAAWGACP